MICATTIFYCWQLSNFNEATGDKSEEEEDLSSGCWRKDCQAVSPSPPDKSSQYLNDLLQASCSQSLLSVRWMLLPLSPHLRPKSITPSIILFLFFFTFHWSTSVFLVPLAFLGGLGGSGSQLKVVKLTASDGLPSKQLHMAWTLRKGEQSRYKRLFLSGFTLWLKHKQSGGAFTNLT